MMARLLGIPVAAASFISASPVHEDWSDRLAALSPDNPIAYFELAEEVADVAATESDTALARRLFGLAGVLDPPRLARSACLGLADIEDRAEERRLLLALARLLDDRFAAATTMTESAAETIDPDAALAIAESFAYYRRGHGQRALASLDDGEGAGLFSRYADAIGGEARYRENARRYRGGSSPLRTDGEIGEMLLLEAALLAGEDRSWSGELMLHSGRTLVEADPNRLAETFGVNPALTVFRGGEWVAPDAKPE